MRYLRCSRVSSAWWSVVCLGLLMLRVTSLYAFFFFQAEDGIRDHCVTGVQTCALPISGLPRDPLTPRGGVQVHFPPTTPHSRRGSPLLPGNRVRFHFAWFVTLSLTGWMKILAHADFSATVPELNLVHEQIDQVDPSPVFGENTLASEWARNLRWVESLPLVLHGNEHSAFCIARATDTNLLV